MGQTRSLGRWIGILCFVLSCGGSKAKGPNDEKIDLDGDPLKLLPGSALVLANLDARAFYTSSSFSTDVAKMAETLIPIGEESGFVPSRDIDRIVLAIYSTEGADAAAIVKGHFDVDKVERAVKNKTVTKSGFPIVTSTYSERTLYTVNNVGFVLLTGQTTLVGSETGIRRTLDKIAEKRAERSFHSWMVNTIETKGAAMSFAADFANQPIATAALGSVRLPFLTGMRAARVVGDFKDPGMHVAGTLTYGDTEQAKESSQGIKMIEGWTRVFGAWLSFVPQVQGLDVSVNESDVRFKFAIDEKAIQGMLRVFPSLLQQVGGHSPH